MPQGESKEMPDDFDPEADYCGCCGDEIPGESTVVRSWCQRCALHVNKESNLYLPPWDRTYEAQWGTPCPFQVGAP